MIPTLFNQNATPIYPADIDVLVCGCGYEDRCTYIANKFPLESIHNKLVYKFLTPDDERMWQHEQFFIENGFVVVEVSEKDLAIIRENLLVMLRKLEGKKGELHIVVDISSMTREWYAALMKTFTQYDASFDKIVCNFYYVENRQIIQHKPSSFYAHPIPGYSSIVVPEKPTALVIGLGEVDDVINYLTEYFSADLIYCFYDTNRKQPSMQGVNVMKWFRYDIGNITIAFRDLWDLCKMLVKEYRVVVIPCGSKPFTFISLLLKFIVREVDIWKIGPFHSEFDKTTSLSDEIIHLVLTYEPPCC